MLISRSELVSLLGLPLAQGYRADMMTSDGSRRAYVGFDGDALNVEVTDHAAENGETLMALNGVYDQESDSFDMDGEDVSGEPSDRGDLRCVAASFRRYALGMIAVT